MSYAKPGRCVRGGGVQRVIEGFPAIDLAYPDLAGCEQGPEQHRHSFRRGQHGPGLDAAAEFLVQPFALIRGSRRLLLRRIQTREGDQPVAASSRLSATARHSSRHLREARRGGFQVTRRSHRLRISTTAATHRGILRCVVMPSVVAFTTQCVVKGVAQSRTEVHDHLSPPARPGKLPIPAKILKFSPCTFYVTRVTALLQRGMEQSGSSSGS